MYLYCISVRTGQEDEFIESVADLFKPKGEIKGQLYFLKKQMRLKTGKEYFEPFFPGYVFFQTDENDSVKLRFLEAGKGFLRFLPSNQDIKTLSSKDFAIISSIMQFGNTVGIVPVKFNEGDRIVITDGPFSAFSGNVKSVNRRNKRVNIELEFLGAVREVSLSYELVQKTY